MTSKHGGSRSGAGRHSDFKELGFETKTMRLPVAFEQEIKEFALDLARKRSSKTVPAKSRQKSEPPLSVKELILQHVTSSYKSFVPIFEVRNSVKCDRESFDAALQDLAEEKKIQLTVGDPGLMTKDQIDDGFVDKKGWRRLLITLPSLPTPRYLKPKNN